MPEGGLTASIKPNTTAVETGPLYASMRENATTLLESGAPIFHADLGGNNHLLRDAFDSQLPPEHRQEFNCAACHHFLKDYGDLTMIDAKTGDLKPLFWDNDVHDDFFRASVKAVAALFRGKKVRKTFAITKKTIKAGKAEAGGFSHMHFDFPTARLRRIEPEGFASATSGELAEMLERVLLENHVSTINKAADLLLEDQLPYASKHKSAIRWLRDLVEKGQLTDVPGGVNRGNLVHLAAAESFLGCIHQLRSGALSTLLEDVGLDLPFSTISRKWTTLVDPIAYMRPTAAPSAGNIAAAERLFGEMDLSKDDLRRKYLLTSDIPDRVFMYTAVTTHDSPKSRGIFNELIPKVKQTIHLSTSTPTDDPSIPPTPLTFASFINQIIPTAKSIEYHLSTHPPLQFLITGLPGTVPLMQWHTPTNLVSNYTYDRPQAARRHNLKPGWTPVSAIIPSPQLWEGVPATITLPLSNEPNKGLDGDKGKAYKHAQHGWRYLVCLEGIEDKSDSLCLFPTFLRSELHGVRSTIEAYSAKHAIEGGKREGSMVGGISVDRAKGEMDHLFRVRDEKGRVGRYKVTLFQ